MYAGIESKASAPISVFCGASLNHQHATLIDLTKNPYTLIFFTDNASLNKGGLRLHSSTAYPISGEYRNIYPQTHIETTSRPQE